MNPEDLKLSPQPAAIGTELIMDGKVMAENLKRRGLDEKWLQKQIQAKGYRHVKEIYLAVCDDNNKLSVF